MLAAQCYECHNSTDRAESGLVLDHRDGLLEGGRRGPAVVPQEPRQSLLLRSLRHPSPKLRMPLNREPLAEVVIDDFERWIESGAYDPRDAPSTGAAATAGASWEQVFEERKRWWSFQPIASPSPPSVEDAAWQGNPVDRFLRSAMAAAELEPAVVADPSAVLRRLSFTLTGLPPTPQETARFVARSASDRQAAVEEEVDRLIASPHFGERWARHWMDWVRYAESHGSEGDIGIPYAWQYRDYLIRALNADVPYDQLVREHIAGDQLADPRIDSESGINESAIGPAQYRFVLHGYSPTDALAEQVRFTDNQIDVISKGFLGLTVSCARCHNHKFDAISQADFYALYGIMASSRPATLTVDTPARAETGVDELRALKDRLRKVMAAAWLEAVDGVEEKLLAAGADWQSLVPEDMPATHPLHPWLQLHDKRGRSFAKGWNALTEGWQESRQALATRNSAYPVAWQLGSDADAWFRHGAGLEQGASPAGEFHVLDQGERIVDDILPAGVYSHTLSTRHSAVLSSPRFQVEGKELYLRMAGDGEALARYVVQNYPSFGETYPTTRLRGGEFSWQPWDVTYWEGDHVYFELSTAADQPVLIRDRERSWIGVTDAVMVAEGQSPPKDEVAEFLDPLYAPLAGLPESPASREELAQRYAAALRAAIEAWGEGTMTDAEARFLGWFVRSDLLPNRLDALPEAAALAARYRERESEIPVPVRVPGVIDGDAFDQPLFERGSHLQPTAEVPRRFLEAIDSRPYETTGSGRMALAESLLDSGNPFTARVIVNRLWHHVFGRGLVATPDNLGSLGEPPSHPELLDYLASRFVSEGWSLKAMLRLLVTTRAFQTDARPSARAAEIDPSNQLLSHSNLRRLEAEAIRDALLSNAGLLDKTLYGEPVEGDVPRRSIYVQIRRNSPDPFLKVFDAPQPVSTKGRRNATNVPSQALALMNHPLVLGLASDLGERVASDPSLSGDRQRLIRLFQLTLGRDPSEPELEAFESFLERTRTGLSRDLAAAEQATAIETKRRREEIADLFQAARERYLYYVTVESKTTERLPLPIAEWDFDGSARDSVGRLHATLEEEARVESSADGGGAREQEEEVSVLRLSGPNDRAVTPRIKRALAERSLELWVEVAPEHAEGTLMALVGKGGEELDSLAFAGAAAERPWLVRDNSLPLPAAEEELNKKADSKEFGAKKAAGKKGGSKEGAAR